MYGKLFKYRCCEHRAGIFGIFLLFVQLTVTAHTLLKIEAIQLNERQTQLVLWFDQAELAAKTQEKPNEIVFDFPGTATDITAPGAESLPELFDRLQLVSVKNDLILTVKLRQKSTTEIDWIGNSMVINFETIDSEPVEQISHAIDGGELIDLNFEDVPVRTILQFIAQFSGKNMVISEAIKGNLTMQLNDVTWQDALSMLLKTQGLIARKMGKAIYITPAQDLAEKDKKELQIEDELRNLAPLKTKVFQIKYGKAENYSDTLRNPQNSLLSARGKVILNKRTNILFIEDTQQKLRAIERYIDTTDIPVRQVEIEARIVTVDKSFEQQLGIKWNVYGGKPGNAAGNSSQNRFNLDLIGNSAVDGFQANSLALATISNDVLIGMELAALEAEGGGQILSNPRLLTADQQEAVIQQGTEIPYQEATSSGATAITFKQAVLRLRVTPQITPNDKIMLQLQVNQDAPGEEIQGIPMIDTRQISSYVLVNNGQTVALGGIYERTKHHNMVRVPFLSDLPWIGNLFKHRSIKDDRKELLIFVTPRIVKEVE